MVRKRKEKLATTALGTTKGIQKLDKTAAEIETLEVATISTNTTPATPDPTPLPEGTFQIHSSQGVFINGQRAIAVG